MADMILVLPTGKRKVLETMAQSESLSFTRRIGLRSRNITHLMDSVERGLRYQSLTSLQKGMGLSTNEIANALDISIRTLARRKKEGRLRQEESERLIRVSRIFDKTVNLFEGDEQEAKRWLKKPAPALGEKSPLEFIATEIGAREVENLIGRLEEGVFS